MEFCGRGGKRLRPRLCMAAYRAALSTTRDPQPPNARIEDLCEAVECFHKASLIHDDIQDCDEERYGRPTVWKEHGVAVAIAAGDWLVAHGYELIIRSGFPNALAMLKSTVASHVALCEGQGDDLLAATPAQILVARALGGREPAYCHVPLVVGPDGRRLAKRHGDTRIASYRAAGRRPGEIIGALAATCGWCRTNEEVALRDLLACFSLSAVPKAPCGVPL